MPWYRQIIPEKEIQILAIRDRLPYDEMLNQSSIQPIGSVPEEILAGVRGDNFTPLSAFQYLKDGVAQPIFAGSLIYDNSINGAPGIKSFPKDDDIGILLPRYAKPRTRQVYWRNSDRDLHTNPIFKGGHTADSFKAALKSGGFVSSSENSVSLQVTKRFEQARKKWEEIPESKRTSGHGAHYGPIISYTEGLFRYAWRDIHRIAFNPNSTESCIKAYAFAQVVETHVRRKCKFFAFNRENSIPVEFSRDDLMKKLFPDKVAEVEEMVKKYFSIQEAIEHNERGNINIRRSSSANPQEIKAMHANSLYKGALTY